MKKLIYGLFVTLLIPGIIRAESNDLEKKLYNYSPTSNYSFQLRNNPVNSSEIKGSYLIKERGNQKGDILPPSFMIEHNGEKYLELISSINQYNTELQIIPKKKPKILEKISDNTKITFSKNITKIDSSKNLEFFSIYSSYSKNHPEGTKEIYMNISRDFGFFSANSSYSKKYPEGTKEIYMNISKDLGFFSIALSYLKDSFDENKYLRLQKGNLIFETNNKGKNHLNFFYSKDFNIKSLTKILEINYNKIRKLNENLKSLISETFKLE